MKNIDRYKTAEKRIKAFWSTHNEPDYSHSVRGWVEMFSSWLDLEAEEDEKPLPCPFCGRDTKVVRTKFFGLRWQVRCKCGYSSDYYRSSGDDAIAAHNRVAEAVQWKAAAKNKEAEK